MNKLQQYSTEDLIDELVQRCAPAVFIGYRIEDGGNPATFYEYVGDPAVCYGLCHQMAYTINDINGGASET